MTAVQTKPLYLRLDEEESLVSYNVQMAVEAVKGALVNIKNKDTYDALDSALDGLYVALGLPTTGDYDPEQYPGVESDESFVTVRFTGDDES